MTFIYVYVYVYKQIPIHGTLTTFTTFITFILVMTFITFITFKVKVKIFHKCDVTFLVKYRKTQKTQEISHQPLL